MNPSPRPGPVSTRASGPVRVAAVDDHPAYLATVELVVAATAGFQLVAALTSGREALVALRSSRPDPAAIDPEMVGPLPVDLLLVDVVMPDVSGPRLVEAYRAAGGRAAVVYLSSYQPDDLPSGLVAGDDPATGYLAKDDLSPDTLQAAWDRLSGGLPTGSSFDPEAQR